ncbi:MAG: DUF2892 domain-containing protein [Bacteroidetes bacterium]|nr:DUF2892 domain-containing protein [Bacteroidota bacterium]
MKKNMGIADRIIRIVIAIIVVVLYATGVIPGTLGIVLVTLSGILVLTSILGICPAYMPIKLNTGAKE